MSIYTPFTILFILSLICFVFNIIMLYKEYYSDKMRLNKIIHYEVNLNTNLILIWISILGRIIINHFTK